MKESGKLKADRGLDTDSRSVIMGHQLKLFEVETGVSGKRAPKVRVTQHKPKRTLESSEQLPLPDPEEHQSTSEPHTLGTDNEDSKESKMAEMPSKVVKVNSITVTQGHEEVVVEQFVEQVARIIARGRRSKHSENK